MINKLILCIFSIILLNSCANSTIEDQQPLKIDLVFSPVFDVDRIMNSFDDIQPIIENQLKEDGFNIDYVQISISTSQSAAAEAVSSGAALLAYLPPITYLNYESENIEPIVVGKRYADNVNTENINDWNNNVPNQLVNTNLVSYFYGNIIVGPTDIGKNIINKIDQNQEILWSDLENASICNGSNVTSGLNYVYPSIWLDEKYGKTFSDFKQVLSLTNLSEIITSLSQGMCDLATVSGLSRSDYEDKWINEWGRPNSIWSETRVLGVTKQIESAMVIVSKDNPSYSEELKNELIKIFIDLSNDEVAKAGLEEINLEAFGPIPEHYLDSSRIAYAFMETQK